MALGPGSMGRCGQVAEQVPPPGCELQPDRMLRFCGTLRVCEIHEDGVFPALNRLKGEKGAALP